MDDRAAFLATIAENPTDDLPRLVFADWLDEHDETERAEFIRLQCRLAQLTDSPFRAELEAREAELLDAHRKQWEVPGLRGVQTFHRGFIETIETAAVDFIRSTEEIAATAVLRNLRLVAADNEAEALSRVPLLSQVESLDLGNNSFGGPARLLQLFQEAPFDRLRALSLRNNGVWPWRIAELAACPVVRQLKRLNLSGNPIGDDGITHIATDATFAGLEELIVASDQLGYDHRIHDLGANAIATSRTLKRLRELDLTGQLIGDSGFIDIVSSANAQSLEVLRVGQNDIGLTGDGAIEALVSSRHLDRLRVLNLSEVSLDLRSARTLLTWHRLGDGVQVFLLNSGFDEDVRNEILASEHANSIYL